MLIAATMLLQLQRPCNGRKLPASAGVDREGFQLTK
jgi:hypothetical protein